MQTNDSNSDKSAVECPGCGEWFTSISQHWHFRCDHPSFTPRQHEILTGILLGDGYVQRNGANPIAVLDTITLPFMEWAADEFGILATGPHSLDPLEETHKPHYRVITRSHPEMEEYADWYSTGERRVPDDISITSLTMKVWYCCDGTKSVRHENSQPRISIAALNKVPDMDILLDCLSDSGFSAKYYPCGEIAFSVDETAKLFDWMGDPLPGFEYKWP